uniref:PA n=1 Tax=Bemisia tabaci Quaranja-like virus 3 TaxID=2840016 RepID=A0A8E8KRX4_9ORTO|nr:PA [Bemisia tabaci Quaranja-like virus 3]
MASNEYFQSVYDEKIVNQLRQKVPNFYKLSALDKDQRLRRYHAIFYLMNTIPLSRPGESYKRKFASDDSDEIISKKGKREEVATDFNEILDMGEEIEDKPPSPMITEEEAERALDRGSPTYEPMSPDYDPGEYPGPSTAEDDEVDTPNKELKHYRFFCPSFSATEESALRAIMESNRIKIPPTMSIFEIDIIDRENGTLIFVKEGKPHSTDKLRMTDIYPDLTNFAFVYLDFVNNRVIDDTNSLNVNSAENFMVLRSKAAASLGFGKTILQEEVEELTSDFIRKMRTEWTDDIKQASEAIIQLGPVKGISPTFPLCTAEDIIKELEDIFSTRAKLKQATWNGKVLPYSCNETIAVSMEDTDEKICIDHFPSTLTLKNGFGKEEDVSEMPKIASAVSKLLKGEKPDTHCLLSIKKTVQRTSEESKLSDIETNTILKGVGWKYKGKNIGLLEGMKQPVYKVPENRGYPHWMKNVYIDECKTSDLNCILDVHFDEAEPVHKMDALAAKCCDSIVSIFSSTNSASTCNKYMNISSRLAGSYLINVSKENNQFSSVALIPLVVNGEVEKKKEKRVVGFCLRGPHHVRDASDKINVIIFEKVKKTNDPLMYRKGGLYEDEKGNFWYAKKNAITKASPVYGAYLHNLLFLPANFVGDMIFNVYSSFEVMKENSLELIKSNRDFLIQRMTETVLMGLLGGSQEEGYFAGYRMLYMVLLELSRGRAAGLIDKVGFFAAMNECLIDSPYVLFLHGNLLHTLKFFQEKSSDKNNIFRVHAL